MASLQDRESYALAALVATCRRLVKYFDFAQRSHLCPISNQPTLVAFESVTSMGKALL